MVSYVFGNTAVIRISPNMCQLHWSLLLSRPQTAIALSRGKAVYIWWKDQHPKCSLAVRWQHESWTSGHHHWLPGTSYSNLSPLQDFELGTEQELTFAAESIIHVWFPNTIPNDRFLITQLQSRQKSLGQKFSFKWCFKQLQVLPEIIKLPIWRNPNNANVW